MALDDRPWWGKKNTLYGGETIHSGDDRPKLGIVKGDRFRVEKRGLNVTMALHPENQGSLRDANNQQKPITLEKISAPKFERAYSMMATVTISGTAVLKPLFLVERQNGTIAIIADINSGEVTDGVASVER